MPPLVSDPENVMAITFVDDPRFQRHSCGKAPLRMVLPTVAAVSVDSAPPGQPEQADVIVRLATVILAAVMPDRFSEPAELPLVEVSTESSPGDNRDIPTSCVPPVNVFPDVGYHNNPPAKGTPIGPGEPPEILTPRISKPDVESTGPAAEL